MVITAQCVKKLKVKEIKAVLLKCSRIRLNLNRNARYERKLYKTGFALYSKAAKFTDTL